MFGRVSQDLGGGEKECLGTLAISIEAQGQSFTA